MVTSKFYDEQLSATILRCFMDTKNVEEHRGKPQLQLVMIRKDVKHLPIAIIKGTIPNNNDSFVNYYLILYNFCPRFRTPPISLF